MISDITFVHNLFLQVFYLQVAIWSAIAIVILSAVTKPSFWKSLKAHLASHGVKYAFSIALLATLASLFLSEIAGFRPCSLCWYQRIAMYPLVILTGLSWWKDIPVKLYGITLASFGAVIAVYHILVQRITLFAQAAPCSDAGACVGTYLNYFGFYSIPFFALCAFIAIIVALSFDRR